MIFADWGNIVRTRFVEVLEDGSGNQYEIEMPVRVIGFAGGQSGPFLEPEDALPISEDGLGGATKSCVNYIKKCHSTAPAIALSRILEDWTTGEDHPTTLHAFSGWTP